MKSPKIVVERLCKVFGPNPKLARELLAKGATKDELFAKTGYVLGVNNASFEVQEGEIFVLMGLSGSGKSTLIRLINRLVEPTAGKVVIDGRDIGTVICPNATAKLFVDASPEVRAHRRWLELKTKSKPPAEAEVLADIMARDERDRNRPVAPLKPAEDAVLLDTTHLGIEAAFAAALAAVAAKVEVARG